MTHYVLFRFSGGADEALIEHFQNTYTKLSQLLKDDIRSFDIYKNCVVRDSNMDMMIRIELYTEDSLGKYLSHPEHTALIEHYANRVISKVSFDHK